MTDHDHDRGLKAVARVREVRERDSRLGLLAAMHTVAEREQQVTDLRSALQDAAQHRTVSMDRYVVSRGMLSSMALAVSEAERRLETSRLVAAEAQSRWQSDKARLRAIRQLVQQRALQRADAAHRAEVREIDDIVGRLHARAQLASRTASRAAAETAALATASVSQQTAVREATA